MEKHEMKVIVVDREDYNGILRSIHGLKGTIQDIYDADLVIDRETKKILKSRHF